MARGMNYEKLRRPGSHVVPMGGRARVERGPKKPTIVARFNGVCAICGSPIVKDKHVIVLNVNKQWVHKNCPTKHAKSSR